MESKVYRVIVSERAKRMLGEHLRFLSKVNKAAATEKRKEIMKAMRSLETMPLRFPLFEDDGMLPQKYRRMFIENWYLVLYRIDGGIVYVDYILDARKDESIF